MAIVVVSLLVIVPLALLVWDTALHSSRNKAAASDEFSSSDRLRPHGS